MPDTWLITKRTKADKKASFLGEMQSAKVTDLGTLGVLNQVEEASETAFEQNLEGMM